MRMRLPKGCTSVVHAGRPLAVAADGTVAVAPGAAAELAAHGLVPVHDRAPDPRPAERPAERQPDRRPR